jgi:uncharacterized protein (DUF1800 family)
MIRHSTSLTGLILLVVLGAAPEGVPNVPGDRAAVVHALNRLTWGPRPGDVDRVAGMGLARWIESQLQPARLDDAALEARLARLETLRLDSDTLAREYLQPALEERRQAAATRAADPDMTPDDNAPAAPRQPPSEAQRKSRQIIAELEEAKVLRAIYTERQLEDVLVDFWFNHFNVFAGKGPTRAYVTAFERDAIRPHVLGDFRTLLEAVAASPAMLFYLDNWMNSARESAERMRPGARRPMGRRPNAVPRPGGTPAAGASTGNPPQGGQGMRRGLNENYARELLELHTLGVDGGYTQDDIVNVARAFTGWTFRPRQGGGFEFVAALHDAGEKTVLGRRIPSGGGIDDGRRVLDIVAAHPSTARFIATKLAKKFVSDTPPPALVERAARRFTETRGSLREVTRTIITSPEFFAPDTRRAKVKTPLEFVVSALRATGADVRSGLAVTRTLRDLGMPPYFCQPPTGYDETASAWTSSGALVARMNFALELAANRLRGVAVPFAVSAPTAELRAGLIAQILPGGVADSTRATIDKAGTTDQLVALTIGSPEFQRQ